ncbi:MAG: integrase core domain-containing protein [Nitrospiria bacterium]
MAVEISDVAAFRIHVITHYYKYGLRSTLNAFNLKQSTFYDWKWAYERNHRRVVALVPKKTRPLHVRGMETDHRIVEFIKGMRKEHGNIGKSMLKPFVDAYAKQLGISSIGETTIQKLIKRRNFTFEKKVYAQKQKNKFHKLRVRKSPKVQRAGFIQMDSIVVYINYEKHLFMCCIDVYTKFAHVVYVENLKAQTAKQVFQEFEELNPTKIFVVQTDNGSEFLESFHEYMEEQRLRHQFIYPKSPKINAYIERFNRTIQEEFILRNDDIYYDTQAMQRKLTKYLFWYNYQRPHSSLKYMSPMNFIATKIPKSV